MAASNRKTGDWVPKPGINQGNFFRFPQSFAYKLLFAGCRLKLAPRRWDKLTCCKSSFNL